MPTKPPPQYSKEQRAQRRYAASLAVTAITRIQAAGLATTAAFRRHGGITLDRALVQSPYELQDPGDYAFAMWLRDYDCEFDVDRHTVGAWADRHTQDEVLAALHTYARQMDPSLVGSS